MTGSRLANLLEQSTPGPWIISDSEYIWVWSKGAQTEVVQDSCWVGPEDNPQAWTDAALIALAPDAVRLLIGMAAELKRITTHKPVSSMWSKQADVDRVRVLLARFAELDEKAGQL